MPAGPQSLKDLDSIIKSFEEEIFIPHLCRGSSCRHLTSGGDRQSCTVAVLGKMCAIFAISLTHRSFGMFFGIRRMVLSCQIVIVEVQDYGLTRAMSFIRGMLSQSSHTICKTVRNVSKYPPFPGLYEAKNHKANEASLMNFCTECAAQLQDHRFANNVIDKMEPVIDDNNPPENLVVYYSHWFECTVGASLETPSTALKKAQRTRLPGLLLRWNTNSGQCANPVRQSVGPS